MKVNTLSLLVMDLLILWGCGGVNKNDLLETQGSIMIVGGQEVTYDPEVLVGNNTEDTFVYEATAKLLLGIKNGRSFKVLSDSQFCSGTVRNRTTIITAAHCIAGFESEAAAIKKAYGKQGYIVEPKIVALVGTRAQEISVKIVENTDLHKHPDYSDAQMDAATQSTNIAVNYPVYDIAVIKLATGLPAWVEEVGTLPKDFKLTKGQSVLLAGFGANQVVVNAYNKLEDHGNNVLRKLVTKLWAANPLSKEVYIGPDPTKSACSGDSGGPAYIKNGEKYFLLGATSRGSVLCDGRSISVYTDVRAYEGWISQF